MLNPVHYKYSLTMNQLSANLIRMFGMIVRKRGGGSTAAEKRGTYQLWLILKK